MDGNGRARIFDGFADGVEFGLRARCEDEEGRGLGGDAQGGGGADTLGGDARDENYNRDC